MLINTVIENTTSAFKIAQRIEDPCLFVVSGTLGGGQAITFEVSNTLDTENGIIDPADDSKWTALLNGGSAILIDDSTNYIFIQAPAYYRLVFAGTASSPLTIMRFKYK